MSVVHPSHGQYTDKSYRDSSLIMKLLGQPGKKVVLLSMLHARLKSQK